MHYLLNYWHEEELPVTAILAPSTPESREVLEAPSVNECAACIEVI